MPPPDAKASGSAMYASGWRCNSAATRSSTAGSWSRASGSPRSDCLSCRTHANRELTGHVTRRPTVPHAAMMDVLIVDDEPTARRTLRECCAREPDLRIVGEYGDSRSALEAIRANPPHLLFLDIQIDSMSGISLARALDPQTLPLIV